VVTQSPTAFANFEKSSKIFCIAPSPIVRQRHGSCGSSPRKWPCAKRSGCRHHHDERRVARCCACSRMSAARAVTSQGRGRWREHQIPRHAPGRNLRPSPERAKSPDLAACALASCRNHAPARAHLRTRRSLLDERVDESEPNRPNGKRWRRPRRDGAR
jgi:hypothetical protein